MGYGTTQPGIDWKERIGRKGRNLLAVTGTEPSVTGP